MKFETTVIAAAALLGAAASAQAADLARKAPAAANYVKVCDAQGAGFFYIPGSDTCLKIGGYVRSEFYAFGNNAAWNDGAGGVSSSTGGHRAQNAIGSLARAELDIDARTATEYGLLRSFVALQAQVTSGNGTEMILDKAFIQFGGLTVGRAQSFFDFYTGSTVGYWEAAHSDTPINLAAYTHTFAHGLSATLSIEDPSTGGRRSVTEIDGGEIDPYGGVKWPDVVLALKIEQAWGKAQVAAALHDNYGTRRTFDTNAGSWDYGSEKSKLGFALMAGVDLNLGSADEVILQASYAKGAISYVLPSVYGGALDFWYSSSADTASIEQTTAWAVAAGWDHKWTETVSTQLEASYAKVDWTKAVNASGYSDFSQLDLIADVKWQPVENLSIIAEADYRKVDYTGSTLKDPAGFVGVLRVQRDF